MSKPRFSSLGVLAAIAMAASPAITLAQTRGGPPIGSVGSAEVARQIAELQAQAKQKGWTFTVAANPLSARPLRQLASTVIPADIEKRIEAMNSISEKLLENERKQLPAAPSNQRAIALKVTCTVTAATCNYEPDMTAVKQQGTCGSCWDFAAMGAWEGNYNRSSFFAGRADTSEQHVLNCSGTGSCAGGFYDSVFNWMLTAKVRTEAQEPYVNAKGPCQTMPLGQFQVASWGYVPSTLAMPSVAAMKQALVQHGALTATINATSAFINYSGGVFNENANPHSTTGWPSVNHGIVIVGWDDAKQAWRVRNSWGSAWGGATTNKGYAWVAYGSNNVGAYAAWVHPVPATLTWVTADASVLAAIRNFH